MNNSEFTHHSMRKNYELALKLLKDGKYSVSELYNVVPYTEAQKAFDDIYEKREKKIATILSYCGTREDNYVAY